METTTLASAQSKSQSLRTTVPASLVRHFGLDAGDQLTWNLESYNNQIVLVVRPLKLDQSTKTEAPREKAKASRGSRK